MSRRVIISAEASRALGALTLPRELLVRLLARVRSELENNADRFRGQRVAGHGDRLFAFRVTFADAQQWHDFAFAVDDATAPDILFVEDVAYRARPIPE